MERIKCCNARNESFLHACRHYFVGYLTAGYPTRAAFLELLERCEDVGMQIFEIGYPARNPYCDGEIIRRAHQTIEPGLAGDLDFWRELRTHLAHPLWLMGYQEDLMENGAYRQLAENGLIDNLVIPNLTLEERQRLRRELAPLGVDVMGFTSDAQSEEENDAVYRDFPLVYQQLYTGPTGVQNNSDSYLRLLERARRTARGYVFAGFGIGTPQRAEELLKNGFDGVIIGTAIMKKLNESEPALLQFVTDLNKTVNEVE